MIWTDDLLIDADYDDLSDSDILVLLLMDPDKPVSKVRLHYSAYLYRALAGRLES